MGLGRLRELKSKWVTRIRRQGVSGEARPHQATSEMEVRHRWERIEPAQRLVEARTRPFSNDQAKHLSLCAVIRSSCENARETEA